MSDQKAEEERKVWGLSDFGGGRSQLPAVLFNQG